MATELTKKPSSSFAGRALEKFRDARQAALEKVGKLENTVEPESLKKQTAILEQHNVLLSRESKTIAKQAKQDVSVVDDSMAVADAFADAAAYFKSIDSPSEFVDVCESVAEFHVGVEDLRLELNSAAGDVAEALRALTKAEVRHAKATKGKYDKVRLNYEAKLAAANQLREKGKTAKADEAQRECDEVRAQFEAAGRDTLDVVETANLVCEYESVERLADYLEAQQQYFAKVNAWLAQATPLITRSREFAQRRRAEVQQREKAAAVAPVSQKGRVFGVKLETLCEKDGTDVPKVVNDMIKYLNDTALKEEGLFRVTGFKSEMTTLRARAEAGDIALAGVPNMAHEVASLLKSYLRELPEPLMTFALYEKLLAAGDVQASERLPKVQALIGSLPPAHRALLRALLTLLAKVAEHADENKMTPANLSIVLSPNVLMSNHNDPMRAVKETAKCSALFEWMICSEALLFD